jgi:hypothetical protein
MKPLRPRVVSVVAAGFGLALGAAGVTHAFAAKPLAPPLPCKLTLGCVPVVGDVRVAAPALPAGLVFRGAQDSFVPAVGGGKQKIKKKDYTSDDKPWRGPGVADVGNKISVSILHSDQPEDVPVTAVPDGAVSGPPEIVKPQAGSLPGNLATIKIGGLKAYVTEQKYPLTNVKSGQRELVPVSSVGIALSPTDHILLTGEGVTLAQLQLVAATLEVL